MTKTLAESLKPHSVDWATLHNKYSPLLNLVRELIGIVPNCDPTLEIWPPGFRTYNLLVPNMFNLPNTLFGSKNLRASMGLAMYASSRAACAYCTAHTCSFALRRGTRVEAIAGTRTTQEQAVVVLAEKLAHIPSDLTHDDLEEVSKYFSPKEVEWLAFSISMMGFLNKFMNAFGIELEQEAINDVGELLAKTGWSPGIHSNDGYKITEATVVRRDNLLTYLRVIRQAPGAVIWEKKWTRGVPSDNARVAKYLEQHAGYSFPILSSVNEPRVLRTLTAVLRDNLDSESTVTGLRIKMYAGYVFSILMSNDELKSEMKNLSAFHAPELKDKALEELAGAAREETPIDSGRCDETIGTFRRFGLTEKEAAILLLAIASSRSPSEINAAVIEFTLRHIEPAAAVEIVVWLSVLQLLSRLSSYYKAVGPTVH